MKSFRLLTLVALLALTVIGCKWQDDFRSRVHPQHENPAPRPTFNEDSEEYVGDEMAKGRKPSGPELKAIDDLSTIPELPDEPTITEEN